MTSVFTKADRCFAVARSTTFAGEREAAIARGIAIAERAGLDLDLFDIPGRARSTKPSGPRFARGQGAPASYDLDELRRAMRGFDAHMRDGGYVRDAFGSYADSMKRAAAAAGARDDETVYDARRRNFEEAVRAAAERDAARRPDGRA